MKLVLRRDTLLPDRTLGRLLCQGTFICHTLEDRVREVAGEPVEGWKVRGETAIPVGNYKVLVTQSTRFKKLLPLLVDVPGFSGIRIHSGNKPEDTEGCVLVGLERSPENEVLRSRDAMSVLLPQLQFALSRGEEVTLLVVQAPEAADDRGAG
jgi:hypothetical protein